MEKSSQKTPEFKIKRAFELRYRYGLTNDVIAQRLGIALRTVRQHLNDPRNSHLKPHVSS